VVNCGLLLHIFWICTILLPFGDRWTPAEWDRPDLLRAARLCRGATLWQVRADGRALAIGRIDDLWLQFADPRAGGKSIRAISMVGDFQEGYFWLTVAEAATLRVRADDPALEHCVGTWRRERVAPAAWHKVGWNTR
jgi:hypothetical protein